MRRGRLGSGWRWPGTHARVSASDLDFISADILALEQCLEQSAVFVDTVVLFRGMTGERLGWQVGEGGRWRVVYLVPEASPAQPAGVPLIETPAEVRVRAQAALPDLLRAVAARATNLARDFVPG